MKIGVYTSSILLLLCLVIPKFTYSEENQTSEKTVKEVSEIIAEFLSADFHMPHNHTYPSLVENTKVEFWCKRLDEISNQTDSALSNNLLLYRALCYSALGQKDKATLLINEGLENKIDQPDFLYFKTYLLGGGGTENVKQIKDMIASIVPISTMGTFQNSDRTAYRFNGYPPRPTVPLSYNKWWHLIQIAKLYQEMNFVPEALNAYLETQYCGDIDIAEPYPFFFANKYNLYEKYNLGELDPVNGLMWLEIAELSRSCGEEELAINAYLKGVCYSPQYAEKASTEITKCLHGSKKPVELPKPAIDVEKMKEIANLYVEINVHPRAIEVLTFTEKMAQVDLSAEKQKILNDWLNLLKRLISGSSSGKLYVFDYEVSTVEDWEKFHIPYPTETFWKVSKKKSDNHKKEDKNTNGIDHGDKKPIPINEDPKSLDAPKEPSAATNSIKNDYLSKGETVSLRPILIISGCILTLALFALLFIRKIKR